jgi:riboflavin kinase/FMN adenylyltransferase
MKRVVVPGVFDGVHRGHRELFFTAAGIAEELDAGVCALTYDTHPKHHFEARFDQNLKLLSSMEERTGLLRALPCSPEVIIDPFDAETANTPWQEYIEHILIGRLQAAHIVTGDDYKFGHNGEGNVKRLAEYCAAHGVGCTAVPSAMSDGERISSTYIRRKLEAGQMRIVSELLGRNYRFSGIVERGRGLGREFGVPTVNIPLPLYRQPPKWGVYTAYVFWNGKRYNAVTNVGIRPTFTNAGATPRIESSIFCFNEELYGEHIDADLLDFIRPERSFDTAGALYAQVQQDQKDAIRLFEGRGDYMRD